MVYVFLADGFEDVEAILPIDLMRRAGITLSTVSVHASQTVVSSKNIALQADCLLKDVHIEDAEALVFPGGLPGADNLAKSEALTSLIHQQIGRNKIVAAICASPARVLGAKGLLDGKKFTCYPGEEGHAPKALYSSDSVVEDGIFITSRGVGTAHLFAHRLIERLKDRHIADRVFQQCLFA